VVTWEPGRPLQIQGIITINTELVYTNTASMGFFLQMPPELLTPGSLLRV